MGYYIQTNSNKNKAEDIARDHSGELLYTAGEWILIMIITPLMTGLLVIAFLPFALLSAWMRVKIWEWFAVPYFHAPHISVWLMLIVGMFVSMFQTSQPQLKEEFYDSKLTARMIGALAAQLGAFAVAWMIHVWILKGGAQ